MGGDRLVASDPDAEESERRHSQGPGPGQTLALPRFSGDHPMRRVTCRSGERVMAVWRTKHKQIGRMKHNELPFYASR